MYDVGYLWGVCSGVGSVVGLEGFYLEYEALVASDTYLGASRDGLCRPMCDGSPAIAVHGDTATRIPGEDLLTDEDSATDEGIHPGLGIVGLEPPAHQGL